MHSSSHPHGASSKFGDFSILIQNHFHLHGLTTDPTLCDQVYQPWTLPPQSNAFPRKLTPSKSYLRRPWCLQITTLCPQPTFYQPSVTTATRPVMPMKQTPKTPLSTPSDPLPLFLSINLMRYPYSSRPYCFPLRTGMAKQQGHGK